MQRALQMGAAALAMTMTLAAGHSLVAAQDASKGSVEVTIKGLKGKKGIALVTIYNSDDAWLEAPKAVQTLKKPITGKSLTVTLQSLPPGTYAVSVIHDENKNGKMDMRWFPFPKPKEGVGASRDPVAKMGPPKWKDAKFTLKAGEAKKLTLKMRYM
jgi:uncharacterized protein (DUF2141 family)